MNCLQTKIPCFSTTFDSSSYTFDPIAEDFGLGHFNPFWLNYCWWKKSCTSWQVVYTIFWQGFIHPGGAGFLPSTVFPLSLLGNRFCGQWFPSKTYTLPASLGPLKIGLQKGPQKERLVLFQASIFRGEHVVRFRGFLPSFLAGQLFF